MRFLRRRGRGVAEADQTPPDPGRLRWERRYCEVCDKTTRHQVVRSRESADRAAVTCGTCRRRAEGYW